MAINELGNLPQTFKVGGKELTVERLNISEIFGTAERKVLEKYNSDAIILASAFNGVEKINYMRSVLKDIPKGKELFDLAQDYMGSPDGEIEMLTIALNKHQKVTQEEVYSMMLNNTTEMGALTTFIVSNIVPEVPVTGDNTEKKT